MSSGLIASIPYPLSKLHSPSYIFGDKKSAFSFIHIIFMEGNMEEIAFAPSKNKFWNITNYLKRERSSPKVYCILYIVEYCIVEYNLK